MKKDKSILQAMRDRFRPENALLGIAESMLPQLGETLKNMQVPKSEGGPLPDGWDKMAFVIVEANGQTLINICPIRRDGDQMLMGQPINTTSAANFFKDLKNQNADGDPNNQ